MKEKKKMENQLQKINLLLQVETMRLSQTVVMTLSDLLWYYDIAVLQKLLSYNFELQNTLKCFTGLNRVFYYITEITVQLDI